MQSSIESRPCPSERDWDELAAGLTQGAKADAMLAHASECDPCAELLRDSVNVFQDLPKPSAPLVFTKPRPSLPRWIPIATAAALLIAAGGLFYFRSRPRPLRELAAVYTSQRSFEMRLPGAAYGALRVERGTPASLASQSEQLLSVAARITGELSRKPSDPLWLHARGRLALLEWQPEQALSALHASQNEGDKSADLLIDLAIAYNEKAEISSQPADWNAALDLLGRALQIRPADRAALFNRALVLEKLHQTQSAIDDLQKLLVLEPSGPWSVETRKLLDRVKAEFHGFFERQPGEDERRFDEALLDRTLGAARSPAALAVGWRMRHGDPWLADVSAVWSRNRSAVEILARMADIRVRVERGRYEEERAGFARLESGSLPAPLAEWRDFESLYRATHARGSYACPADADAIAAELARHGYRWLLAQALRELGYCSFQRGDLVSAARYAALSREEATRSSFPISEARTSALFAHIAVRQGRLREAFRLAYLSLESVEKDRLPVARRHEFLNVFLQVARSNRQWQGARCFAQAMAETAQIAHFADLQFTSTVAWAEMTQRTGDPVDAAQLYRRALQLYSAIAPSDDRAWAEIELADASGDESALASVAAPMEASPDAILWVPYQRVRARLAVAHGRLREARERLDRLRVWLTQASVSQAARWLGEFRNAAQIDLGLLVREGRLDDSFREMQQWRRFEEPVTTAGSAPRPAGGVAPRAAFSFAVVDSRVAAWRREDQVKFRWVPLGLADFEQLASHFGRLLSTPASSESEIQETGARLERVLFGNWLASVPPGQGLLIQVDDTLANFCFAALPGRHGPLALEHPLSVTRFPIPDAPHSAGPTPARNVTAGTEALIVDASRAQPSWAAGLPALPSAEGEAAAIAHLSGTQVVRGEDVTPELLRQRLAAAALFYFAGHAAQSENGLALVLSSAESPDALFALTRLQGAMPPTVILSACSTGLRGESDIDTGDPESIAASFLQKGSREVIASLWNVDSQATANLMVDFYGNLTHGLRADQALSRAMAALRESQTYRHPHYWAAFADFVRL